MNIEKIKSDIQKTQKLIDAIDQLLKDYDSCVSEISKKLIESAIVKYHGQIALEQQTAN